MDKQELETLKGCMLFRNMTEPELFALLGTMNPRQETYRKGDMVLQDGEMLSRVGIILSGKMHLYHVDPNGNLNLMDLLGPGRSFGELNAVGRYKLHLSAQTTEPMRVLSLEVEQLLRKHVITAPVQIRFLQNLTLVLAQRAQYLTKKLEDSIRRTTREKLQDYLSGEYHKAGSRTFSIPLNRQNMADFLFVDRSAMSNELCKMRDEGLLKFEKSQFELLIEMPITEEEADPNEEKETGKAD